jgi:hypothetical protein
MHTKDKLAEALRQAGLPKIAGRAARGEFDDFLSPHATPQMELIKALDISGSHAARAIRKRVINGDFDATKEESEAWAASPEGQATFRKFGFEK